jgi:ubiquinone/menaquinone biosynthesis C-methylase UbiE
MGMEKPFRHKLTPEKIVLDTFAFARTRILSTAVDLEVFTHIARGKQTASELSQATGTKMRSLEMVLNALCAMDYLEKTGEAYRLTPLSRFFLVKGKKMYYGDYVKHVDLSWGPWLRLTSALTSGKPSLPAGTEEEGGFDYYKQLVPLLFATTHLVAAGGAKALGIGKGLRGLTIMDVGAGSGAWGIAMAQQDPTCQIYAVDDPKILEETRKTVRRFGLEKQFHYIAANVEEDSLGQSMYDLATLSYVCHGGGKTKSRKIISAVYQALKEGGKVVICEICPDENREKDLFPLIFGVNMLIHTTEGNTFTVSEYTTWLKEAGFKEVKTIDISAASPLVVGTK